MACPPQESPGDGLEHPGGEILGLKLPHIELYVRPGRDMARLVEGLDGRGHLGFGVVADVLGEKRGDFPRGELAPHENREHARKRLTLLLGQRNAAVLGERFGADLLVLNGNDRLFSLALQATACAVQAGDFPSTPQTLTVIDYSKPSTSACKSPASRGNSAQTVGLPKPPVQRFSR